MKTQEKKNQRGKQKLIIARLTLVYMNTM